MLSNIEKVEQVPHSFVAVSEGQTGSRDNPESIEFDDTYGPWIVVSQKKKDSRGAKKSNANSLPVLRYGQQRGLQKEPLERKEVEWENCGPSTANQLDGKRKAQFEVGPSLRKAHSHW